MSVSRLVLEVEFTTDDQCGQWGYKTLTAKIKGTDLVLLRGRWMSGWQRQSTLRDKMIKAIRRGIFDEVVC